ncbi:unnamed protein product, partial [Tuber aestivum]
QYKVPYSNYGSQETPYNLPTLLYLLCPPTIPTYRNKPQPQSKQFTNGTNRINSRSTVYKYQEVGPGSIYLLTNQPTYPYNTVQYNTARANCWGAVAISSLTGW